jgi:hypothetical protein
VLAYYTWTTHNQWVITVEQVKLTADSFRVDERAWVDLERVDKIRTIPASPPFGTIFKYGLYFKNGGKTSARHLRIYIANFTGGTAEDRDAVRMFQDRQWREQSTGKPIPAPDTPAPQTLDPGSTTPIPAYSTGQEPTRHDAFFLYSYVVARIDYIDAFNVEHWKHFCFMIMNSNGELGHCESGNDEDNNPETKK